MQPTRLLHPWDFPGKSTGVGDIVFPETNLDSILKSRDIALSTKVRLIKAMVFPIVMYGCESWNIKKAIHGTPLQYSCLENLMDGGAW